MGRLTELECGRYRCRDKKTSQVSLLRLSFSSSLFGRFYFMHSLRSKILHRSIKKMSKTFWKWKKLEQLFENFWKFLRSKNFRFFRKFSLKFVWNWKFLRSKIFEIFRSQKFQKFSLKIVWKWKILRSKFFGKFFDLKNFQFSTLSCSNFLSNQSFLIIFFMDRCRISWRRRWNRLERPKMHSEKDKRKMSYCQMNGNLQWHGSWI